MHIPDGFLPPQVCLAGYALTGGVTWYSLRQIKRDRYTQANIPKASLLTAAFFVASLISIPIPPTSVHLIFNGLMGAVLGYYAFPAILIGLFFQAVMFQHGGMSTLGINAIILGVPALAAYYMFRQRENLTGKRQSLTKMLSFAAGAGALLL
ncbi:MAG: cobalt transporter CbiM, partial [Cyanobacteria bacterium J06633_1]